MVGTVGFVRRYGVFVEETRRYNDMGRLGSDHLNGCLCAIESWDMAIASAG